MIEPRMDHASELREMANEMQALARDGIVSVQIVRKHRAAAMYQAALNGDPEAQRIYPMIAHACKRIAGGACTCVACGKEDLHNENFVLLVCEPNGGADAEAVAKDEPLGAVLMICQDCASTNEKAMTVTKRLCAEIWPSGRILPGIMHEAGHA